MSQEHVRIRPNPISMPVATGQRPRAPADPRACTKSARQMWLVFLPLLVIAGVYLMVKGRGNNFLADDWNWVQYRHSGLPWIVASYNQHLLAVPIALYQMLFATVGLAHYWVFRLFLTLAHLACVTAVFAFARRRIGWAAVAVTLPLLFLGSGWEYVLDPVNSGFVASIGLGVCALSALERGDRRGDALACALLVLGLACSELAVVFAAGIVVELLWRDRRLDRIWIAAVPLVLYAAWWLGYHQPSMARQNLTAVPAYGADLAASAIGGLLGLSLDWGRALLVAGILVLGRRLTRPGALTPRTAGLLAAIAAFWLLVALGRAQLGAPSSTRYIYTGVILIVLILAEVVRGSPVSSRALWAVGVVALFALVANIHLLTVGENSLRNASRIVSAELGALQAVPRIAPAGLIVDPTYAPQVFSGQYFSAIHAIGSSPADSLEQILRQPEPARSAADTLLVRAGDLPASGSTTTSTALAKPPTVERSLAGSSTVRGACIHFQPTENGAALDLLVPPGGVQLSSRAGPPIQVLARRFASGYEGSPIAGPLGSETITVRPLPDSSPLPWHLRIATAQAVLACAMPVA